MLFLYGEMRSKEKTVKIGGKAEGKEGVTRREQHGSPEYHHRPSENDSLQAGIKSMASLIVRITPVC